MLLEADPSSGQKDVQGKPLSVLTLLDGVLTVCLATTTSELQIMSMSICCKMLPHMWQSIAGALDVDGRMLKVRFAEELYRITTYHQVESVLLAGTSS